MSNARILPPRGLHIVYRLPSTFVSGSASAYCPPGTGQSAVVQKDLAAVTDLPVLGVQGYRRLPQQPGPQVPDWVPTVLYLRPLYLVPSAPPRYNLEVSYSISPLPALAVSTQVVLRSKVCLITYLKYLSR